MLWKRVSQRRILSRKLSRVKEREFSKTRQLKIDGISRWRPKRKILNSAKNRVLKKQKFRYENGKDERTHDPTDLISELPEPIIHHILSFIRCPKDTARISVLSKRWRSIWASFLTFDFDQKNFKAQGTSKENFKNFVDSSLSTRLGPLVSIQKFRLYMTSYDSRLAPHIDSWLCAATAKNVKELEIHLEVKKTRRYSLPRIVLAAETLTTLKLYGCKLDNYSDIKLPNLRQLSIKKASVDMNIIQSFIHSCPFIEELRLVRCTVLDCLLISTLLKLESVEVHECPMLKQVQIATPSLRSFWCCSKRHVQCNINLGGCENLKSLTLKDSKMTDETFQGQISNFPVLEKLVLMECDTLQRITILSSKLKSLSLIRCKNLLEAIIDVPNLHLLKYTGNKMPFSSMNAPNLQEANLYLSTGKDKYNLHQFLRKFTDEGLKLVVCQNKDVIIHEVLRDAQLRPFNNLKLHICKSSTIMRDLMDSLLTATHPETLSVISRSSSELLKFLHEKIMRNGKEDLNCCGYYSRKCWRHYLKDVTIAEQRQLSAGNPSSLASSTLQRTTFGLKWRSMKDIEHAMED